MSRINTQNQLTITRTYDRPVTREQKLGSVPSDYYEPRQALPQHGLGSIQHFPENEAGPRDIKRPVPEYNADGTPRMETVTETLSDESYDSRKRAAGCGALGAAAAGAVAGTLAAGPIGTVVGALAGAAAGGVIGFRSADGDQVSERWVEKDITHPSMHGYNEYTLPVPEFERVEDPETGETQTEVDLRGYYHHYGPCIEETKVGSYQQPEIEHSKSGALKAGVLTVGAGLAVGLLAALFGREK